MHLSQLYLASASPRRSALLTQIGLAHHIRPVDVDESSIGSEAPQDYVCRLAQAKAGRLWQHLQPDEQAHAYVLGSDTCVVLEGEIFGKPADRDDAVRMLQRLSGRTHQVQTAVALRTLQGCETSNSISEVSFRELSIAECEAYWQSGEPADKAGSYAVQGQAAIFITRMTGSYSGIMGLPLYETAQLLQRSGWQFMNTRSNA
jgi:septum formation protein